MTLAAVGDLSAGSTALRLGVGALFGGVVGFERELDGHDAGLRTHLLLALGAALFGVLSVGAFGPFITSRNADVSFDPSRIASYVAAGVGFLGGGVILKHGDHVRGLTTAASLWTAAAIGLASGLGFWAAAAMATGIAWAVLFSRFPVRWLAKRLRPPVEEAERGGGNGSGQAESSRSKNER